MFYESLKTKYRLTCTRVCEQYNVNINCFPHLPTLLFEGCINKETLSLFWLTWNFLEDEYNI